MRRWLLLHANSCECAQRTIPVAFTNDLQLCTVVVFSRDSHMAPWGRWRCQRCLSSVSRSCCILTSIIKVFLGIIKQFSWQHFAFGLAFMPKLALTTPLYWTVLYSAAVYLKQAVLVDAQHNSAFNSCNCFNVLINWNNALICAI